MTQQQISEQYRCLVAETFHFVKEYFENIIPAGRPDPDFYWDTKKVYDCLEADSKQVSAECLQLIADYLEATIAYLENSQLSRHLEDRRLCRTVLLNTVQRIANLAVWLETLYRDSTACYVRESLGLTLEWKVQTVHSGVELLKNDAENK